MNEKMMRVGIVQDGREQQANEAYWLVFPYFQSDANFDFNT